MWKKYLSLAVKCHLNFICWNKNLYVLFKQFMVLIISMFVWVSVWFARQNCSVFTYNEIILRSMIDRCCLPYSADDVLFKWPCSKVTSFQCCKSVKYLNCGSCRHVRFSISNFQISVKIYIFFGTSKVSILLFWKWC